MLYNCPQHGLNCPHNFNFNNNSRLALKGASIQTTTEDTNNKNKPKMYVLKTIKPEVKFLLGSQAFDSIRNMCGLNNDISTNQLKGASTTATNNNVPLCDKTRSLINLKQQFGLT